MATVGYEQNFDYITLAVTAAYLGGTPATWVIEFPDLTSVEGWDPAWGLSESPAIVWTVAAEGGVDRSLGDVIHDGDVAMSASVRGGAGSESSAHREAGRPQPVRGGFPRPHRREE